MSKLKTQNLSDFFNNELVDYASYDNLRKIASIMDGLKNSGRKIIHTTIEDNINNNMKLSQYGSRVSEQTEYLHGSIDNVIVTLARDYAGTNNMPLLQKKGNFGTRFANEASAARYIFARKKDYLDDLFLKEDSKIVPEQYFEGTKIEPKFFVPTLPMLLINGSDGISSGFAQTILPRDPKEIRDYLVKRLEGVKPRKFPMPFFNGFDGVVKQGDTDRQFIFEGKVTRKSANRVLIEEVPVHYELKSYLNVLDKLEEDKLIQGYTDMSNNSFKFEVRLLSRTLGAMDDDQLLNYLKLTRTVSENYTSMTHENKIKEYESPEEIMDDYIEVKLEYVQKRKDYMLNDMQERLTLLNSRYIFIDAVISDKLKLAKRKKEVIIKDIDKLKVNQESDGVTRYDYLLRMPVSSMTAEELKRLQDNIKDVEADIKELSSKTPTDIWLEDIKNIKF